MILNKFVVIVHKFVRFRTRKSKMHPLRQKVHRCLERNIYFCFVKIIRSNTQKEQLHEKELYL